MAAEKVSSNAHTNVSIRSALFIGFSPSWPLLFRALGGDTVDEAGEVSDKLIDIGQDDIVVAEAPPDGRGKRHEVFVILKADGEEQLLGIATLKRVAQLFTEQDTALHVRVHVAQPVKKERGVDLGKDVDCFLVGQAARREQAHPFLPGDCRVIEGVGVIHLGAFHLNLLIWK